MFNVRLAGDHLYGKWLFTWLSLVMLLMVSCFVLSFFARDVLDELWDRIESVPEVFFYVRFLDASTKELSVKLNLIDRKSFEETFFF